MKNLSSKSSFANKKLNLFHNILSRLPSRNKINLRMDSNLCPYEEVFVLWLTCCGSFSLNWSSVSWTNPGPSTAQSWTGWSVAAWGMLSCCIVQSIQRITSSRLQQQGSKKVRKCRFFVRISQISQILQIVDFLIKTVVRFLFSQSFALFLSFKEKTFLHSRCESNSSY